MQSTYVFDLIIKWQISRDDKQVLLSGINQEWVFCDHSGKVLRQLASCLSLSLPLFMHVKH